MSQPYRLGENAVSYFSATPLTAVAAANTGLPTTAMPNISNVKVSATNETPNYDTRNNGGVKQYAASLSDYSVTFELLVPGATTDAAYTAFQTAFTAKTEIAYAALSAPNTVAGAAGPCGNWIVAKFERDESNGKVLVMSVELKPSTFNSWFVSTGS